MKIYVLCWKYSDGSGCGIIRAFEEIDDASDLFEILVNQNSARTFFIQETNLVYG